MYRVASGFVECGTFQIRDGAKRAVCSIPRHSRALCVNNKIFKTSNLLAITFGRRSGDATVYRSGAPRGRHDGSLNGVKFAPPGCLL